MNNEEIMIRKDYRYRKDLYYVYDVYSECEFRANKTDEIYEDLEPGEFRFDYDSWCRRLDLSKHKMEIAIRELTQKKAVIVQTYRGKKGTSSKYFLTRLQGKKKEKNDDFNKGIIREEKNLINQGFEKATGEESDMQKGKKEGKKTDHSSLYSNHNIESNIYIADFEELWKLYPNKKGRGKAEGYYIKLRKKYSKEELLRCVERYSKEVKGKDKQYIKHGSTFLNGGYSDYLDSNYIEESEEPTIAAYRKLN